jgi:DNA invertase Pin-like site-specific DNA recombinase
VAFASLAEGIDATSPVGKVQMHILGAIAEFERGRIVERVRAGLARAKAEGTRLGRPRRWIDPERLAAVAGLPDREPRAASASRRPPCNEPWPKNPPNRRSDFRRKPGPP